MTKPIFLLGEAFGEVEARFGQPFLGSSGAELIRMLGEAGVLDLTEDDHEDLHQWYAFRKDHAIARIWAAHSGDVYRTNVFNIHPPKNDHLLLPRPQGSTPWRGIQS